MHCQNCGKKIREGSQFCPSCGAPVRNKQETEPEWEEYEDDYSEEENVLPSRRSHILLSCYLSSLIFERSF